MKQSIQELINKLSASIDLNKGSAVFWTKIKDNKEIITKIFIYLYNRYPDPDGIYNAFNNLVIRFYELDVFERFNMTKLLERNLYNKYVKKDKMDEKSANSLAHEAVYRKEITEETIKKYGIDLGKKWEQFLYKWIEHVVTEAYDNRKKHSERYLHGLSMHEFNDSSTYTPWVQDLNDLEEMERWEAKGMTISRRRRVYPTRKNIHQYVGTKYDPPLESIEAEELNTSIYKHLRSEKERKVYNYVVLMGIAIKDVAGLMNCSQQNINQIVLGIKSMARSVVKR